MQKQHHLNFFKSYDEYLNYYFNDKIMNEGYFKEKILNGYRKYFYQGHSLEGFWKDNTIYGYGLYNSRDKKVKYRGNFKECMFSGEGCLILKNVVKYLGDWDQNKMYGYGITYGDDFVHEGIRKDRLFDGHGTIYYSNNECVYEGNFLESKRNGFGIFKDKNGDIFEGNWKNNMKNGEGIYYFKNSSRFLCKWKDDLKNGKGFLFLKNGLILETRWKNGEPIGKLSIYPLPRFNFLIGIDKIKSLISINHKLLLKNLEKKIHNKN